MRQADRQGETACGRPGDGGDGSDDLGAFLLSVANANLGFIRFIRIEQLSNYAHYA